MDSNRTTAPVLCARVCHVEFDRTMMHVVLLDGRELGVPLQWFPRLRQASPEDRAAWRLLGDGAVISWDDLDEDVSVEALLVM